MKLFSAMMALVVLLPMAAIATQRVMVNEEFTRTS